MSVGYPSRSQREQNLAAAVATLVDALHTVFPGVVTRPIPPYEDEDFTLEVRLAPGHAPTSGALVTALDRASHFHPSGRPATLRVAAGDPDGSVLLRRVSSREAAEQMPPFGTRLVDEEAVALLSAWIRSQSPGAGVTGARTLASHSDHLETISKEKGR